MAESEAQLSDNMLDCVRQCVREELSRRSSGQQSLIQRTRQLISSSASTVSRDLRGSPSSSGNVGQGRSVLNRPSAGVANRPFRMKQRKTTQGKPPQTVVKSVYLLEQTDFSNEEYSLTEDMILVKGQCEVATNFTEDEIREELVSLFTSKFPLITAMDFDFVKRERNIISKPIVKQQHKWDFKHVKNLCGNGRLYVRLNVCSEVLSDDDTPVSQVSDTGSGQSSNSSSTLSDGSRSQASVSHPSTSTGQTSSSSALSDVEYLSTVFPNTRREVLRETVLSHHSIDSAAAALCDLRPDEGTLESGNKESAHDILKNIRLSMKSYGQAEKVKVDRQDLVMDIFHYYKSTDFDPSTPIKIQVRGEPAIDTGGVLRQVFTDFFSEITKGTAPFRLFTGPDGRLSPVYSSEHILTGVFEILGKIIAHSIIQGGPGFPYLAPGIFWYIATGDLTEAVARSSFLDIADPELGGFVERIKDGGPSDIDEIARDDSFLRFMVECGQSRLLTQQNKEEIVQCIVLHNCILKHKAIVDQFRKGLSVLGLLDKLEKSPQVFEKFFVHEGEDVTAEFVTSLLKTSNVVGQEEERVVQMLLTFVRNASKDHLADFLYFTTGSRSQTAVFLPQSIDVSVGDTDSIFASTCSLSLKLPSCFRSYAQFESSMMAVMKGKSFSTA